MKPEHVPIFLALPASQLMGLCIYREASGEPYAGKIAVGTVILNRVDLRDWDGDTLYDVILMPWQFSWTMPQAGADYYNESVRIGANWDVEYKRRKMLRECCSIAQGMLSGEIPRDPDLAAAQCCQYLNPKTAAKTRAEWIGKGMTSIKLVGRHEFFMEAA